MRTYCGPLDRPRQRFRRRVTAAVLGLALLGAGGCAPTLTLGSRLGTADSGTVWFKADSDLLMGTLTIPPGRGPFPAVVLLHDASGLPSSAVDGWRSAFLGWGYATFVVDSFSGRNLKDAARDALAFIGERRIPDAYAALALLATYGRIDPGRVLLMGFGHGAVATLGAATAWARETFETAGRPGFRGFVAFYPSCNRVAPELARLTAPVRIHVGALDDWTPAEACVRFARSRSADADVQVAVYPDAHHAFDREGQPVRHLPDVDNAGRCSLVLSSLRGPVTNAGEVRRCAGKGATIGWSLAATEAARQTVHRQLADLLAPVVAR